MTDVCPVTGLRFDAKAASRGCEALEREVVPAWDGILGRPYQVLDDGFVRLVEYLGGESTIVRAARVSYGAGTHTKRGDIELIRYLLRRWHTTPVEQVVLTFHVRVPMDTWRQWIRNRTARVNEYSTRYSEAIDSAAKTLPDAWRRQSGTNKQGSGGFVSDWTKEFPEERAYHHPVVRDRRLAGVWTSPGDLLSLEEESLQAYARDVYERRLELGVAREQARKDLPLSTYTEAYWQIDLHNLLNHFLALRLDSHAQREIRSYAEAIYSIVRAGLPNVVEAFDDFHPLRGALTLTRPEIELWKQVLGSRTSAHAFDIETAATACGLSKRELSEFQAKLARLGLV